MKGYFSSLIAVGATVLLITSMAAAQTQQRPGRMMHRGISDSMRGRWTEQLGLSDAQKEQIHQVLLDTRKKNIEVNAKEKVARIELHELVSADSPDQKEIDAQIATLAQLQESGMRNRVEAILAVQKVLTPEQRKKAKELRSFGRFLGGPGALEGRPGMGRQGRFGRRPGMGVPPPDDED
jgi:Spy/CpxP family protein refolding chaperone